jgi:transposase
MYVRTTTRKNKDGSVVRYLQLAESVWDAERQRSQTRILHNLGREDELDAEALRRLAQSLLRVAAPEDLERLQTSEAVPRLRIEWAKEYGGLHVLHALWRELGLKEEIERVSSDRPSAAALVEAAFLLVANRALAPESKLGLYERWMQEIYWPPAENVQLHHLYLALDLLAEQKAHLEKEIFFRVADLLSADVDLLFYDTTSVYFEVEQEDEGEAALRRWGHSKDERPNAPQIVIGLAVTREGLPVKSWIWPGNTADVSTIEQVKQDLAGWRLNRVVYVADGGMMSEDNLSHLSKGGSGYIVGVPLRRSKEAQAVLSRAGRFQKVAENLEVKEITYPSAAEAAVATKRRRYVLCRNPEEARRQKHRRDEMLRELEAELKALEQRAEDHPKAACRLQASRRFGSYLRQRKNGRLEIDRAKVAQEEKLDGKWLVITNDASLSAEDVALGYKQLIRVEESFRRLKHGIDIRPVHHRTPERIQAHVFACVLALLLERVAERRTGERWGEIRRQLGRQKMVAYAGTAGQVLQTTEPTSEQHKLLKALKIDAPKLVHHIG